MKRYVRILLMRPELSLPMSFVGGVYTTGSEIHNRRARAKTGRGPPRSRLSGPTAAQATKPSPCVGRAANFACPTHEPGVVEARPRTRDGAFTRPCAAFQTRSAHLLPDWSDRTSSVRAP